MTGICLCLLVWNVCRLPDLARCMLPGAAGAWDAYMEAWVAIAGWAAKETDPLYTPTAGECMAAAAALS